MLSSDAAREFVESYIREWHACWKGPAARFKRKDVDFEFWAARVAELDGAYFVKGAGSGSGGSFSSDPDHDPATERVVDVELLGDVAHVETEMPGVVGKTYWVFEVRVVGRALRLTRIDEYLAAKTAPLVAAADAERVLAAASDTATLEPLSAREDPNIDHLFRAGRRVRLPSGGKGVVEVRRLGELAISSGVVGLRDFGYDSYDLSPLARRIPAGRYPVDVSIAGRIVAAVCVRLRPDAVVGWHPANALGAGHIIGVDAANVAVFDMASFVGLTAREKERLYVTNVVEASRPNARLIKLREENDCVIVESGTGDGYYPCHFGVDDHRRLAALLVDFAVLATFPEETVEMAWTTEQLGRKVSHPRLEKWNVEVAVFAKSLVARGAAFKCACLSRDGAEVVNTEDLDMSEDDGTSTYEFRRRLPSKALSLEITLSTGYRNR